MSEILIDFRKLSMPNINIHRNSKIEQLKQQLGNKYLLAKCMPKLTKESSK